MQQIADWLKTLGMSEYAERFAENGIDFSVLPDLTEQDLKGFGRFAWPSSQDFAGDCGACRYCPYVAAACRTGPVMPLRSLAPRSSSSNRLPSSFRVPSAITTVFGSATPCKRAARFGVSPTIACS